MTVQYCTKCVYPSSSAAPLSFDSDGVCTGCLVSEQKDVINWNERWSMFEELVNEYRRESNYEVVIGVSGGKDSYFLCHLAKELGLKALLVTYYGNNYLPEGESNLQNMYKEFKFDHYIFKPSQEILIKMNRLGFIIQCNMNWHADWRINSLPVQMAIKFKIC